MACQDKQGGYIESRDTMQHQEQRLFLPKGKDWMALTESADDNVWMQQALRLARYAEQQGEVPVGALVVQDGVLIAEGWNQPIATHDMTAHAEIIALRAAAKKLGNYRLPGATLYVTLEPCAMCAGAMIHSRIERLVYAATDPRTGAAGSVFDLLQDSRLNHQVEVSGGVCAQHASTLLTDFFRLRRKAVKT